MKQLAQKTHLITWVGVSLLVLLSSHMYAQDGNTSLQRIGLVLADHLQADVLYQWWQKKPIPLADRPREIIQQLQAKALATQPDVIRQLNQLEGVEPTSIQAYWVTNVVYCDATPAAINRLKTWPNIAQVILPSVLQADAISGSYSPDQCQSVSLGLKAIHAHEMWEMGYTGYGSKVLLMDSGVDGDHPAYQAQYWGNYAPEKQAWFDPTYRTSHPTYYSTHGTHVLGTMVGLDPRIADTIGVAFGANWMAANIICDNTSCPANGTEEFVAAFQWALNPDGDIQTVSDLPDVINNSWSDLGVQDECQNALYRQVFSALEAAGVAIIFSAGNLAGPGPSIPPPKNINIDPLNTFCVGAVDVINQAPYTLYPASSRGPSVCGGEGQREIKPEVVAPGFLVRSSFPGGGYRVLNGTSMAAPHVSGAILLLKEAFPDLDGTTLKRALYESAIDLGAPGEDNAYGRGLINVKAAYDLLVSEGQLPQQIDRRVSPGIIAVENLPALICESQIQPDLRLVNFGTDTLTELTVSYAYSAGLAGSPTFDLKLAPGDTALLNLPAATLQGGRYELSISISSAQGQDYYDQDNHWQGSFWYEPVSKPIWYTFPVCQGRDAVVFVEQAEQEEIRWYRRPTDQDPFFKGAPLLIPAVKRPSSIYVKSSNHIRIGAKLVDSESLIYDIDSTRWLHFDAHSSFMLESVAVDAEGKGEVEIRLHDADGNIQRKTQVPVVSGPQRVLLYWDISPGIAQRLSIKTNVPLARQDQAVLFPVNSIGLCTITGASRSPTGWNFMYDWQLSYDFPCGRSEIPIEVTPGDVVAAFDWQSRTYLPVDNPTLEFLDRTRKSEAWFWAFGDGDTSWAREPIHTYQDTGQYEVYQVARSAEGCTDATVATVQVLANVIASIPPPTSSTWLYPNPGKEGFFIKSEAVNLGQDDFAIYDLTGRKIPVEARRLREGHWYVYAEGLAPGVYLVRIQLPTGAALLRWQRVP